MFNLTTLQLQLARYAIALLLLAGLFGYGYVKGYRSAESEVKAEQAAAMEKAIAKQREVAQKDYDAAMQAIKERDDAIAKNQAIAKQLKDLMKDKKYQDCKIDAKVKAQLNQALK